MERIHLPTTARPPAQSPKKEKAGGRYFKGDAPSRFFGSGCALLDCMLGGNKRGGWAHARVINIVGDTASGKSLLAIEACANFARQNPKGRIRYRETESAFDIDYAAGLGLPLDRVELSPGKQCLVVEDVYNDLVEFEVACKKAGAPGFYVLDSLDALSDAAEMERGFGEGTYGTGKAKDMSQLFRRINQVMAGANITLMVISQTRDAIGVTFGRRQTRSGGRALDFYASQIVWLAHRGKVKRKRASVERPVGDAIVAKCEKSKVGPPHRQCEFTLLYGYGIDDLEASLAWLAEVDRLDALALEKEGLAAYRKQVRALTDAEYASECRRAGEIVAVVWAEIEKGFEPPRRKYEYINNGEG